MGDVENQSKETAQDNAGLMQEIRRMLGFALGGITRKPIPYFGEDESMYLGKDEYGFRAFPMADMNGDITLPRLKDVYQEVAEYTGLDDTEKRKMYRKIYSAFLSLGFEDADFESQLNDSSASVTEEEVVEESKDELADTSTIYEFAFNADGNVDTPAVAANAPANQTPLLYRNILRTGTWKLSPNGSKEPLTINKTMLDNIVSSFKDTAFEHVTVPETHNDLPSENRGFIRDLAIQEDEKRPGEYILRGGFEFTNQQTKQAVLDGSIASVSCGIVFKHARKRDGKLFDTVLHHVALTNKPWIDNLGNWDKIAASEYNANIIVGLEQSVESSHKEQTMPEGVQLTQEEYDRIIAENKQLKLGQRRADVTEMLKPYQDKNINPAVLTNAEKILLAASSTPEMMTLAQDNSEVSFKLADAVKAMLDAMPEGVDLSQPKTEDGQPVIPGQKKPANEPKSAAEKAAEIRKTLGLSEITDEDMQKLGG